MRFQHLYDLKNNRRNKVIYFDGTQRIERTFAELYGDVDIMVGNLKSLEFKSESKRLGILGPISYEWMVLDLACILGGFQSVAMPETYPIDRLNGIVDDLGPEYVLMDGSLQSTFSGINAPILSFRKPIAEAKSIHGLGASTGNIEGDAVQKLWSFAFTSGTSGNIKPIRLEFKEKKAKTSEKKFPLSVSSVTTYIKYKQSYLSQKNNKLIVFMPFSHAQQRTYVHMALRGKADILISDPMHCLSHLASEQPNIMVSAPMIYETLASLIEDEIVDFTQIQRNFYGLFLRLGVNKLSNRNPIKWLFNKTILKTICDLYGRRADYFVTGNAPITKKSLQVFYNVGVKIYESYGQSEVGAISMSDPFNFRLGSVGKPIVDLKIAEDGEILVKFDEDLHEREILNVNEEGYVRTGDLGSLDEDGFLYVQGRKDDLIVMGNGKKVLPFQVEEQFFKIPGIENAVVLLKEDNKLGVILGLRSTVNLSVEEVRRSVEAVNQQCAAYEKVHCFYLLNEPFTVENGYLTGSLKYKRKVIEREFGTRDFIPLVA